ncbi:retrovirus-related pol polyprotein from transposon TNT 1-94 [Tanacetum coccineum]
MEEVKGIKKQILIPSDTSSSVSQACSSKTPKQKDYLKRYVWYLDSGCSRHITRVKQYLHRYSKELGPKVAYVNGLKHNLISISQLCDANFKVLFTKTQGTIFNQNDEIVLIAPRRRDVYIIDMSSFNKESNACFLAKATLRLENLNEVRVKELRSDNGTEFRNHKLEEFCDEKGISQNFLSSCTLEQNGLAERRNRTLIKAARTISIILKRHGKTAYDVFRGRAPDINYLYVFGCPVHIHNHRD